MKIKELVQRHAIAFYFFLAFAVAWLLCLVLFGPLPKPTADIDLGEMMALFISMLAGPSVAGLAMTAYAGGRFGLWDFFSELGRWDVGKWYAALLIFPALILITLTALTLTISPAFAPNFVPTGLIVGLLAGFFEELGWSGFAYPRLREKFGWVKAALILGGLWGLWHLLPDYLGAFNLRGESWLPHFCGFVLAMIGVRFVISWVYNHTRSVFLCQLMHSSSTGFLAVFIPANITPAQDTLIYYVYSAVMLAAAVVLLVKETQAS